MHEENKGRWDIYFDVQGQKLKGMKDDREVKKRAEERKIMSTETTSMSLKRNVYFAEKRERTMKETKARTKEARE